MMGGGGADWKKERKKERTDNKNPKQTAGQRSTSAK